MSELGIRNVRLSPDGKQVTWLAAGADGERVLDLWTLDDAKRTSHILVRAADIVGAAVEALTGEEKARRERQRLSDVGGIVDYSWAPAGDALLFPLGGHLYHVGLASAESDDPKSVKTKRLTTSPGEVTDAHFSPRGRFASYVRDRHLWVVELSSGNTSRLSPELKPHEFAGSAEFIAQEEMHRFSGYWWSPDDARVAFTVVDEEPVAVAKRMEVYADRFETIEQRYPFAGGVNAVVRLLIHELGKGAVPALLPPFEYLGRVDWDLTGDRLYVQTENREQTELILSAVEPKTGVSTQLLVERDAVWINLHEDFRPLPGGRFLWASERSGFKHLEVRRADGSLERTLTSGDWVVRSVRAVTGDTVYFDGFMASPLELQLYSVSMDAPSAPTRLTSAQGWHDTTVGKGAELWVDVYSSEQVPPSIHLYARDGTKLADLSSTKSASTTAQPAKREPPVFGSMHGPDGTELYYRVRMPKGAQPGRRYPVVVRVYGGPGAQMVQRSWQPPNLEDQLAAAGFVVFSVDNRGSKNRGKRFEGVLKNRFGGAELEDQAAALRWFSTQDYVDPERIGIVGASYGGYMTLMAMLREPALYKAGVSISPVTDWSLYDTHYTERYIGTPEANKTGYELGAVLPYAAGLEGHLLIMHGMADDNVLYTHSTKIYKALQEAGKRFDIMVYPGEKHGITGPASRKHKEDTIVAYFTEHLKQ